MNEFYGQGQGPMLMLHGGAGTQDPSGSRLVVASQELQNIGQKALKAWMQGMLPIDVVVHCLQQMEDSPLFNAGYGAALQADGQARLTAALMDGEQQRFSGVIGAMHLIHPSTMAKHLQGSDSRVIGAPGVELLARQLHLPLRSPISDERLERWIKEARNQREKGFDTVGCVLRTGDGKLYAGTSTGGRGFEFPGRVSDSGTVAGTYASRWAAVSATGIGEELIDDALAARLETRCRDQKNLQTASHTCYQEAAENKRSYGWICLSDHEWGVACTTPSMSYAVLSPNQGLLLSSLHTT